MYRRPDQVQTNSLGLTTKSVYVFILNGVSLQFVAPQNGSTDVMEPISSWQVVYSDRENQWPISGINIQNDSLVTFKVRAKNRFGYSNYSAPSRPIDLSEAVSSAYTSSIGMGIINLLLPIDSSNNHDVFCRFHDWYCHCSHCHILPGSFCIHCYSA